LFKIIVTVIFDVLSVAYLFSVYIRRECCRYWTFCGVIRRRRTAVDRTHFAVADATSDLT